MWAVLRACAPRRRLREHIVGDENACSSMCQRAGTASSPGGAVPSSSIDALAIAMPVNSQTIV
jgi:hypothetical protein